MALIHKECCVPRQTWKESPSVTTAIFMQLTGTVREQGYKEFLGGDYFCRLTKKFLEPLIT